MVRQYRKQLRTFFPYEMGNGIKKKKKKKEPKREL